MATFAHTVEIARPVEEVFARRSVVESDEGPVPFRGVFELEPTGRRTRFTWTIEAHGVAARLAGPLAARLTLDELATSTLRLKHLLEENRA